MCIKDAWLSAPWVSGRHWSLMGGHELLPDKRKESVPSWCAIWCQLALDTFHSRHGAPALRLEVYEGRLCVQKSS
jgi:hypothetical protein